MIRNTRGVALGITIVTALLCAIAAYVVLLAATSEARRAKFFRERTEARHLAEAALVFVMQRLWDDPNFCPATVSVDTNGDGTGDTTVPVTVTSCGAGNSHTLQAKVTY